MSTPGFDVIGDIHGQLGAFEALGRELGYAVDDGWSHPEGRVLVFLGDLVDRGPHSVEVATLACELERRGRALGVMGNHEYNLVAHGFGIEKEKHSNRDTIADVARRRDLWGPVLEQLARWPLAIELPDLRIVHAVWHLDCVADVRRAVGAPPGGSSAGGADDPAIEQLRRHVALGSPFTERGFVSTLTLAEDTYGDAPHAVLMKGYEEDADAPFLDSDGAERHRVRVTWWSGDRPEIADDRTTVFGHYWNLPPEGDAPSFAPPHPSGHPALRAWQTSRAPRVAARGRVAVPREVRHVCVDYNGMMIGARRPCVGALRWPEREVAWAVADDGSR